MTAITFTRNERPTLGVEVELQLVDAETCALTPMIEPIRAALDEDLRACIKPELMQSYLEINTGICDTVSDVQTDLLGTLRRLEAVTDPLGVKLFWGGTHPFSTWKEQVITDNERYHHLVDLMQDVARKLVTFGLHVHVGVESGDKAIMICDRLMSYLPLLLALSSNSPFWDGRATGLHSSRSKIMEGLPTAGLPQQMRNWSEYVWLIKHLKETKFINSIREIWWDIRPHHNFGTVEVRVCDVPADLSQVLALTALVQCLVVHLSREIDEGAYVSTVHPMMVQQNKWRATRYGCDAELVVAHNDDLRQVSVPGLLETLLRTLEPIAVELGCHAELSSVMRLPGATGSNRQLALWEESHDGATVVREMLAEHHWSRTTPEDAPDRNGRPAATLPVTSSESELSVD